jgi:hypothetical protein
MGMTGGESGTEQCRDGVDVLRLTDGQGRRALVDLAHQTAQDRAGTHLNIRTNAQRSKAPHDLLPPDGRGHLADQRLDCRTGRTLGFAVHVRHDGYAWIRNRQCAQLGRESLLGGLHQRAVERGAHRKRHDTACPERLHAFAGPRDGITGAGDDDLARSVEIGG